MSVTICLTLCRGAMQPCKWTGPICISNTLTITFLFLIFKIAIIFVDARWYLTMILSCVSLTMNISLCVQIGYLKVFVEISVQFLWLIFYWFFILLLSHMGSFYILDKKGFIKFVIYKYSNSADFLHFFHLCFDVKNYWCLYSSVLFCFSDLVLLVSYLKNIAKCNVKLFFPRYFIGFVALVFMFIWKFDPFRICRKVRTHFHSEFRHLAFTISFAEELIEECGTLIKIL